MRVRSIFMLGTLSAIGLALVVSQDVFSHYEEPAYTIISKDGAYELRKYPELICAEVIVPKKSNWENEAFRILAGYIFGKNRSREKIPMTVPVTMEKSAPGSFDLRAPNKNKGSTDKGNVTWTSTKLSMTAPVTVDSPEPNMGMRMRFYLPSKFNMADLPVPIDERIRLIKLPSQTFAVIRFSGLLTAGSIEKHKLKLFAHIKQQSSYKAQGNTLTSAYNAPWTLPFLRRNEVWIPLAQLEDNS